MTSDEATAGLYRLMERYIDGDRRAFVELHDRLTPRLRGFLMRLVRDRATTDDLVQVTLLKAHLARDRFRLQGGDADRAVQAWYFAIARNAAMDHLRAKGRADKRMVDGDADAQGATSSLRDHSPNVEELTTQRESEQALIDRVQAAIAELPAGQREVVELHKLRGMSMAEVAKRLQLREGAVRVRAHRGYKALARLLGSSAPLVLLDWGSGWGGLA